MIWLYANKLKRPDLFLLVSSGGLLHTAKILMNIPDMTEYHAKKAAALEKHAQEMACLEKAARKRAVQQKLARKKAARQNAIRQEANQLPSPRISPVEKAISEESLPANPVADSQSTTKLPGQ